MYVYLRYPRDKETVPDMLLARLKSMEGRVGCIRFVLEEFHSFLFHFPNQKKKNLPR